MSTLLDRAEQRRIEALDTIGRDRLAEHEQFFTPFDVAQLMSELLVPEPLRNGAVRLLDPGAGSGVLSAAVVQRLLNTNPDTRIHLVAVEKDDLVLPMLAATLADCADMHPQFTYEIVTANFIYWATQAAMLAGASTNIEPFDLCIQNPPYSKLAAKSEESTYLKKLGIHAPNIYAAFMAVAQGLLTETGRMTAITPRSFYNGSYFEVFRKYMAARTEIESIHTFESRREVFADTGALQESIITTTNNALDETVPITVSASRSGALDVTKRVVDRTAVLVNGVIFVPATEADAEAVSWMNTHATATMPELPFSVSTGRVVDFRNRDRLTTVPAPNTVPMVYPANFTAGHITHPKPSVSKSQWYVSGCPETDKNLVPAGCYVLVKRFSSKEEKRRINAAVWNGERAAFDNKTNFFHSRGAGIDPDIARGLCRWLNSSHVDQFFRVFSGHTQVNAGDLKMMPYPTTEQLLLIAANPNAEDDSAVREVMGD